MPVPLIIAAGIGAGASYLGQRSANKANRKEAMANRAFQERMSNTQWQRGVEDMRAAGINPALAYSQGPASSPGGSLAAKQESSVGAGGSSAVAAATAKKSMDLIDAQIAKVRGEAASTQAAGRMATFRTGALLNMSMDWDRDGRPEQLGMDMIRNEWLQGLFSAQQTRNLAQISGIAGGVSANLSPALQSFSSQAGRGLSKIANFTQGTENFFSGKLQQRLREFIRLRYGRNKANR